MSSIDQQFVEYVVKSLVSKPDAVKIERRIDEKGVLLELTVDPEDLGRVIGKRGATAQSLRTLLRALGTKNDARYNLKIVDNGLPYEARASRAQSENEATENESAEEQQTPAAQPAPAVAADDDDADDGDVATEEKAEAEEESDNDRYSKTRRELEEMDDLDL